jgi:uncharacterized protein YfaP (DUF2135 family)
MMVQVKQKDADIKTKAEFVIILTWDDKTDHDIDLWLENPHGDIIFYKFREFNIMHLDRDDRGWITDQVDTDRMGTPKTVYINQEIMSIRGFITGEWTINVHYYRIGKNEDPPVNVKVQITKLNPSAKIIFTKNLQLKEYWEEQTIVRMTMAGNGDILALEENLPKRLVETRITQGGIAVTSPDGRQRNEENNFNFEDEVGIP